MPTNHLFETTRTYTLQEIEQISGFKPRIWSDAGRRYAVIDINGDYAQYDFKGSPERLSLILIDGEPVEEAHHAD